MTDQTVTNVTTPGELAEALGDALDADRGWHLAAPAATPPDAGQDLVIVLAGRLGSLVMSGDAQVQVGGGVTLATVAQYVQSQTGIAPGWPLDARATVASALTARTTAGSAAARIITQMAKSVVEVEVARGSTRTTEIWEVQDVVREDGTTTLPDDAVVAVVTVNLSAAAAAVRASGPSGLA